jgi:hypothetical protein
VAPYVKDTVAIAGGIKATHDLAQILYNFLHPTKQEKEHQQSKNKVVIVKKEKGKTTRIELYHLSAQEIEKILEQ